MIGPAVVYIIDDDPDDQEFLIEALKAVDPSIECFTANNGQDGLKKLKTTAVPFLSIVILDLNMPRINGRQMLIHLKSDPVFTVIPVIICSTSSNQNEIEELKALRRHGLPDKTVGCCHIGKRTFQNSTCRIALQRVIFLPV